MKVPLNVPGDLFTAVCLRGADTLINDATEPRISARLPLVVRGRRQRPLVSVAAAADEGQPFALIYADQAVPGGIVVDDKGPGFAHLAQPGGDGLSPSGLTSRRSRQPDNWGMAAVLKNLSPATHIALFRGLTCPAVCRAVAGRAGLVAMYSASYDHGTRFVWATAATCPLPEPSCLWWRRCRPRGSWHLPCPVRRGVVLLLAVALFGITRRARSAG